MQVIAFVEKKRKEKKEKKNEKKGQVVAVCVAARWKKLSNRELKK